MTSNTLNIYGEPLQPCQDLPEDTNGSWNASGRCAGDGIHSVCVQSLPQSFCDLTEQNNWCQDRVRRPHCICQGAYAAYATHAPQNNDMKLKCSAINQDILDTLEEQALNWRPGMRVDVPETVRHLYRQCVEEQGNDRQQRRVDDLRTKLCNMYKKLKGLSEYDIQWWTQQNCPEEEQQRSQAGSSRAARQATRKKSKRPRRRGSGAGAASRGRRRRGSAWPPAARAFRGTRRGVGGALF